MSCQSLCSDPCNKGTNKAGIKVWNFVRIGTLNVRETARERIFQEVKHGKELARRPVEELAPMKPS